jgi:membrane-associated phospholipid phosphatase
MLLSTLPGGGHYVVDLLAGCAVWSAWFFWSRQIERQISRQQSIATSRSSHPGLR